MTNFLDDWGPLIVRLVLLIGFVASGLMILWPIAFP